MVRAPNPTHRVTVLDVVKTPGRHNPIVLLQPSPRLQDVFPSVDLSDTVKLNHQLPNLDSAYVGILEDTGSLFVMSSDRFPLVAFGDANPNLLNPLIDPPPGTSLPVGGTPKSKLDEITKARKLRELCDRGSLDPRCLTGMRKLESSSRSRLSRLLDAAPVSQTPPSVTSAFPTPSSIEGLGDNRSLANLLPPWPSRQAPLKNLPSNLPFSVLVILSSIIGGIIIGRKKWGSTQLDDSVQPPDVPREVEPQSVERAPLTDATSPEQPLNRLDPPEASNKSVSGNGVVVEDGVPAEDTGESEKEDRVATPIRKKPLRRRRGKKKKGPNLAVPDDLDGEVEPGADMDAAEEQIQLVVATSATSAPPSPALVVSDEILGMLYPMCVTLASYRSPRLWFPWNGGFQGVTTGPSRRCQASTPGLRHLGHPRSQYS